MPSINTSKLQGIDPSHTEINNSTDLNIMATNQVNQDTTTNTTTAATSPPHPPTNNTTLQQQNNNTNSPIQESNDVINTATTTTTATATATATTTTTDSNNINNTQTNNNSNNDNNNNIVRVFPNGNNTRNDISQTQIDQSRSSTTSPLTINLDGIANKINNDLVRSSQGDINSIHNNNSTLDNTNDAMSKIRLPITSASYSNIQDRNRTHSQQQQQQQQQQQHNSNIPQPQSISLTSTLESSSNQLRIFQRMDEMAARLITMEEQFIKLTKTINLQNDTLNGLQSVIRDFSKQMEENVITQKQRHDHQLNMYQSQNQERQFAVDLLNSITKISSTYLNTFPTNGSNQSHNNNNLNSHYVNNNNNNNNNNNIVPVPTNYTNATQNDILLQNKYNNTSNNSISSMNNSSSMPPLFPLQSSNFIHFKKKINSSNDDFILNPNGIKRRKKNHVHQHHNNNTTTNNNNVINTNNNSSTRLNSQSAIPPSLSSPLRVNTVPILVNSKKDALTTNNKPINKTGLATSTTVPQMTNICNDNPTTNNANIPTATDLETLNIDQFMFPTATQSQQLPNSTVPSNNGPITISNVINRDRHTDLINSEGNISSNNAAIVNTSTTNNTSNINNDLSIPNNSNHSTSLQPQRGKTTDDEILVDEEGYQEDDDEGDDDEEDDNLNHKTNTDSIVHVDDDDEEEYDEEEEDGITQDNNIHDENDDIIEDEEEDNEDDMDDNNGPQEMDAADKERKIVKRAHMMSKNKALRRIKPRVEGEDQPSKIDKGNPTPEIKSDLNYKILKAPNNVKTIWDEYVYGINGNPSIRGLEEKYGNKWRLTKNRKTFSRRKRLYKYILNGIDKGKTADEMIKILEERRLYRDENGEVKRRTIGWLQQSLTGI